MIDSDAPLSPPKVGGIEGGDRGDPDLLLMVRPDKRGQGVSDILIEFKYLGLNQLGLSGEAVRGLSDEELRTHAEVEKVMDEAKSQLDRYEAGLLAKHSQVSLRKYVVVGVGLERIVNGG